MNPFKRKDESKPDPETGPIPADPGSMADGVDETAALIDQLERQLDTLRQERDAAVSERDQAQAAWKHAMADFQNFQRRSVQNEQSAREQAVRSVLHSILPVVDHFEMALALNPEASTARQVIDGVSMIKDELLRAVSLHGVQVIKPARGEAFDASRHKAIAQQPAVPADVSAGNVLMAVRVGYEMDGRVIRPAEVIVASAGGGSGSDAG
jgi:molecular chaperone GrpE